MRFFDNFLSMMPGTSARHKRDVLSLAAQFATQVKKKRDVLIELNQQTESLTKKDIATWRQAWQAAINYEQPNRCALLDVYNDALVDLHLSGCIAQRKGKTLQKPFVLSGKTVRRTTRHGRSSSASGSTTFSTSRSTVPISGTR